MRQTPKKPEAEKEETLPLPETRPVQHQRKGPLAVLKAWSRFLSESKTEAEKITWPSWKETWVTSVMVAIMVTAFAAFMVLLDVIFGFLRAWLFSFLV